MYPLIIAKLVSPIFTFAATTCTLAKPTFFFIPPWWEFLSGSRDALDQCSPAFSFPNDLLAVGLAIVDMLIRLAGTVAIVSVIIAGVTYITAAGNPEKAASARRRIYNSLIGLAVAFVAAGVVAFIGNSLK